jgi:transcription antitermination factor NusG
MDKVSKNKKLWYALYVKPKHEFKAKDELNSLSIENYLPVITRIKQWSDRKKKINEPLLKGYIFIYGSEVERLSSVECSSVVKCLFDQGKPASIPEWQIDNLKNLLNSRGEFNVSNSLIKGNVVEIIDGPFKGVRGIIDKIESENYLAVSIELLNRTIIVRLPGDCIIR